MRTLNESDLSSNELGIIGDMLKRHFDPVPQKPRRSDPKVHRDFVPLVTAMRAALASDPGGPRRRLVRSVLNEYHVDSVSAAVNLGIVTPFKQLLETWGYGLEAADKPGKGSAPQSSGGPAVSIPLQLESRGVDPSESEGRRDLQSHGPAGDRGVSDVSGRVEAHGGGEGDGGSVQGAPSAPEAPGGD
jgi:hypothetical protein